jgi:hypothetical protein
VWRPPLHPLRLIGHAKSPRRLASASGCGWDQDLWKPLHRHAVNARIIEYSSPVCRHQRNALRSIYGRSSPQGDEKITIVIPGVFGALVDNPRGGFKLHSIKDDEIDFLGD